MASCPECDAEIEVDELDEFDVAVGDRVTCVTCHAHLEVVNIAPVELAVEADERDEGDEETGDENPDGSSFLDRDDDPEWDE